MDEGPGPGEAITIYDDHGTQWVVTERGAAHVPGARGPRCLVFMSEEAVRRVWAYPATWRYLSADALLALSERR
jgi:hypothetical protein